MKIVEHCFSPIRQSWGAWKETDLKIYLCRLRRLGIHKHLFSSRSPCVRHEHMTKIKHEWSRYAAPEPIVPLLAEWATQWIVPFFNGPLSVAGSLLVWRRFRQRRVKLLFDPKVGRMLYSSPHRFANLAFPRYVSPAPSERQHIDLSYRLRHFPCGPTD